MVIVKVYREQGKVVALDACGRADARRGGAVVESAVAAILHTLLVGLGSLKRIAVELKEEEALMHIAIKRGQGRSDVQVLMNAVQLGLRQQSKRYPCQLRVVERVIYPEGVVL